MSYLNFTRTADERLWAALAHASIALGIILGLLLRSNWGIASLAGPIAALVIFLVKKDESHWVARQAMQALLYQAILALISIAVSIVMGMVGGLLARLTGGAALALLGPIALLLALFSLVFFLYALYGAYQCYRGRNFKYAVVGDFIRMP